MPGYRAAWIYFGCVLVVASLALGWRSHRRYGGRACGDLVPVVVASHPLPRGTRLTYDDLSQRAVPERFVRARDVTPDRAGALIGKELLEELGEGEPITWLHVAR